MPTEAFNTQKTDNQKSPVTTGLNGTITSAQLGLIPKLDDTNVTDLDQVQKSKQGGSKPQMTKQHSLNSINAVKN